MQRILNLVTDASADRSQLLPSPSSAHAGITTGVSKRTPGDAAGSALAVQRGSLRRGDDAELDYFETEDLDVPPWSGERQFRHEDSPSGSPQSVQIHLKQDSSRPTSPLPQILPQVSDSHCPSVPTPLVSVSLDTPPAKQIDPFAFDDDSMVPPITAAICVEGEACQTRILSAAPRHAKEISAALSNPSPDVPVTEKPKAGVAIETKSGLSLWTSATSESETDPFDFVASVQEVRDESTEPVRHFPVTHKRPRLAVVMRSAASVNPERGPGDAFSSTPISEVEATNFVDFEPPYARVSIGGCNTPTLSDSILASRGDTLHVPKTSERMSSPAVSLLRIEMSDDATTTATAIVDAAGLSAELASPELDSAERSDGWQVIEM
jgi:hypothetical protein